MIKSSRLLTAGTLVLWHGGNLDEYDESLSHGKGRWEYGPGLYLTTHYDTARKYSKGSRKLYRITIESGNEATRTVLPYGDAVEFAKTYAVKAKLTEVLTRFENWKDKFTAEIFINILLNNDALKSSKSGVLRSFLVQHGVDYLIVDNAFGWHERMVVLFNMKKIVKKEIIRAKDPIEEFDLPTEFAE